MGYVVGANYLVVAWPDHGVPAEQELLDLILQVNKLEDEGSGKGPTVVHCR
jgi:hypothetical protein